MEYVTRESVSSLQKKYPNVNPKHIIPDGNSYTGGTEEEPVARDTDGEMVNVYTRFFRNDEGQVMFTISTQYVMLKDTTPLNPFYKMNKEEAGEEISFEEEPNTTSLMDDKDKEEQDDPRSNHIWNLYPFARLVLNERDNCFYGVPVTMEYLESQKSINNHYSIYDKALQDNVLGGFFFRNGVLDESEVTAENGQMIGLDTLPNEDINKAFARFPVANVPQDSA